MPHAGTSAPKLGSDADSCARADTYDTDQFWAPLPASTGRLST
jgi:hypothetical protein